MDWDLTAGVFGAALGAAILGTGWVLRMLIRGEVLDMPNERSSHTRPTPRGGGLAVVAVLVPLWLLVCALDPALPGRPLAAALLALPLAVLCWADDRQSLSARARFLLQILAVTWGMSTLPEGGLTQGWLPPPLDWALSVLGWLWFVNLYNFMDGIDGIAGCQTAALGLGFIVLAALGMVPGFAPLGAALAGAALGFLCWNWPPARIFLGDVGSVPLGFLTGWLLLALARQGAWAPALILPAYYLADATWTLLHRLAHGEKIWQAHRTHFYQRAALKTGHLRVTRMILATDLGLVALAAAGLPYPRTAVAASILLVLALLWRLRRLAAHGTTS